MYGNSLRRAISAQVSYDYPQQPYYLDPQLSMLFPLKKVGPSIKSQRGVAYGDPSNYGVGFLSAAAGVFGIGVKLWGAKTDADIKRQQAAAALKAQEAEAAARAADKAAFHKNLPLIIGGSTLLGVAFLSVIGKIAGK